MSVDYEARREVKETVRKRDNSQCVMCGAVSGLQVHHVVFLSRGGADSPSNCVTLCEDHHTKIHEGDLHIVQFEADEDEIHDMQAIDDGKTRAIHKLEEQEKMKKADVAHHLHKFVAEKRQQINDDLTDMAFALCKFKEMNLWDVMGYRSMREWCQDPDIDLRYDKVQRLVRVVKRHCLGAGRDAEEIKEMGIYKADRISQFHDQDDYDELVSIATGASRADLDDEIKERKGEHELESGDDESGIPDWIEQLEQVIKTLKDHPENTDKIQLAITILNKQLREITGSGMGLD